MENEVCVFVLAFYENLSFLEVDSDGTRAKELKLIELHQIN